MGDEYTEQKVRIYKAKKQQEGKFTKYMVKPIQKLVGMHHDDQKRDRLTA